VSGAWRTSCKAAQGEDLACDKIATFAATFEPAMYQGTASAMLFVDS